MIFYDVVAPHDRNPILMVDTPVSRNYRNLKNEFYVETLLSLSHVCTYWRDVALGNPALWARIDGRGRDQVEVFLERSHPLTVTLLLDVQDWDGNRQGPHSSAASIISTHGARLGRLDLSIVPTRRRIVPLLGSLQAPHLACLILTSPYLGNSCEGTVLHRTPLLDEQAPSLRALAVAPVVDWMPSGTFPHLTHLLISFDRDSTLYHEFDVLQLLSNTPALKFLHVNFLFSVHRDPGDWQPPPDPISLRHLRSLVFTSCSYELIHTVLWRLSLPQEVFIRFQDILIRSFDDDPPPLPPLALNPVTFLDLFMRYNEILLVADGPTSGLWLEGHDDGLKEEAIPWTAWLLTLHECLTLSLITHLHISVDGEPDFWQGFLAHLPQVTHLAVLLIEPSEYARNLPDAVRLCPTASLCHALSPSPTTPIRCPVLHTLTIEWQDNLTANIAAAFPRIPAMLTARADAGHPVHHLVVQATPHPSWYDPRAPALTALDVFRDLVESLLSSGGTTYEIAERMDGAKGLCAFEMRGVWRVDGEDEYWDVDDYDKPRYVLPTVL